MCLIVIDLFRKADVNTIKLWEGERISQNSRKPAPLRSQRSSPSLTQAIHSLDPKASPEQSRLHCSRILSDTSRAYNPVFACGRKATPYQFPYSRPFFPVSPKPDLSRVIPKQRSCRSSEKRQQLSLRQIE